MKKAVREALDSDVGPQRILDSLNEALEEVGERYERGEYFLSELMMVGVLAAETAKMLEPYFGEAGRRSPGKVIFGTVKGDIHDIGKNIVIMMLRSAGFEIVDLGVDVAAEKFAKSIENENCDVLALSALLTSTMDEMKKVIETLEKAQIRDQVKIIVGGRPITRQFSEEIGADGYAKTAIEAVKVVKQLLGVSTEE